MDLWHADKQTLAGLKAGLTRDAADGTLLCDDEETIFFFTTQIAPDNWLYVEVRTEPRIQVHTGVFQRPADYMRAMIRAEYAGLRFHQDRLWAGRRVGQLVTGLTNDARQAYRERQLAFWQQDAAAGS